MSVDTFPASEDLSAATAVYRLLMTLGVRTTRQAVYEAAAGDMSPNALVRLLQTFGTNARAVSVAPSELHQLSLPALIMLRGGGAVMVSSVDRRGATVNGADGFQHRIALSALRTRADGTALELVKPLPAGTGFATRVLRALAAQRGVLGQILLLSVSLLALSMLVPLIARLALDQTLNQSARELLFALVLASLVAAGHRAWLGWLRERVLRNLEAQVQTAGQQAVFGHLLDLPLGALQKQPVGVLLKSLQNAESATGLLTQSGVAPLIDGILAFAYWSALCLQLPLVGLGTLLISVVALCGVAAFAARHARLHQEEVSRGAEQQGQLFELLSGAATIKAAGAERQVIGSWLSSLVDERTTALLRERNTIEIAAWLETAQELTMVATFTVGGYACLQGELTLGGFLSASMLADAFTRALTGLASALVPLWAMRRALAPLDELLSTKADPLKPVAGSLSDEPQAAVVLDDVWFRYGPDQPWILKGTNLSVAAGQTFELRGASGIGKTTILRLMAGLCAPERGTVAVAGVNPARVCTRTAYVPQEAHVFAGSILSNLRILSGGAQLSAIEQAARRTGLHAWVSSLPMQYETVLPPGGGTLSGGQRQLVVLTAVLASDAQIVLLDEALTHIDHLQRERLSAADLWAGRTVVTVRHD